jgi:hypothetical protein
MAKLFRLFEEDKQLETLLSVMCGCKHLGELRWHPTPWELISCCENINLDGDCAHYAHQAESIFKWLDRGWLYRDAIATNTLRQYAIFCFTIGLMQGMKTGRKLDTKTEGNVATLLKHSTVRRLLLKDEATNLEICKALDKRERMPWLRLHKQYGTWEKAAGTQSVRTLISQARRVARQRTNYEHLLSVLKTVNDASGLVKGR